MEYTHFPLDLADAPLAGTEAEVLAYWESKRGAAFAPALGTFRLDELPTRAVPWCSVVDVVAEPLDFIVRFWGSARRELLGREITGMRISAGDNKASMAAFEQNVMVVERRRPIYFKTTARYGQNEVLEYGSLRLPLSGGGEFVDKIFNMSYHPELRDQLHALHGTLPSFANMVLPPVKYE